MKTKEIVFEGWEIDMEKSGNGKVVLREVLNQDENSKQKAKTWREVQDKNKYEARTQYVIDTCGDIIKYNLDFKDQIEQTISHLPSQRAAEKIRALCQMYILADYYNREYAGGWVADWEDANQTKVLPCWHNEFGKVEYDYTCVCSEVLPAFASAEILMNCYNNNKEVFENALKP